MAPYVCPPSERALNYQLYGVIVHKGGGTETGHYVAYTLRDGIWYDISDSTVRMVSEAFVLTTLPYMLFYKAVSLVSFYWGELSLSA